MKIYLTRDDVFKILLDRFGIRYFETFGGDRVLYDDAEIYWEGNKNSTQSKERTKKEILKEKIKDIFHQHCSGSIDEDGHCNIHSTEFDAIVEKILEEISGGKNEKD